MAKRRKLPFFAISAVTGEGIEPLKYAVAEAVKLRRPLTIEPPAAEGPVKRHRTLYPPPANSARGRA